ncbi:MAG: TonB-dependent receptor [Pseudomonadota bacterium]|nr:TonB-dependent receptor [Pseudomonadota bacterium]
MKPAIQRRFKVSAMALSVASAMFVANGIQAAQAELEEIQVTGTRIRTTDGMVQPTPVTAVTTEEMRNFDPSSSVSEQLDNLPQFLNTQTAQRGGATLFGDAAGSYLNLRNMGKQRTLVLFDGSRIVPADRASTVNVDNFPTALVRNVDVVTGGASAAYGADALAGVVNFVLDREFEGFKSSVSTGVTEFGDGENWNFSVAGGKQIGDRLHVIGSVEAREINQIYRDPQDLESWNSWGWVINPAWNPSDPPGTNPQRLTVQHAHHATQNAAGIITVPAGTPASVASQFRFQGYTFTEDGSAMRPFIAGDYRNRVGTGSNQMQAGGPEASIAEQAFDGGPLGAEVVQRSAFAAVKYDISDSTNVFAQVMAGRTESNTYDRRGNPEMGQQYFGTVYRENPFLPPELAAEMDRLGLTSLRIDKIGQLRGPGYDNFYDGRNDSNISQMWSSSAGFETEFENDWLLRGTYQYGESKLTSEAENMARIDHWYLSMDAVRDPATGAIVCNVQRVNPSMAQLQAAAQGVTVATTNLIEYPDGTRSIPNILSTPERSIRDCVPMNVFGIGNVSPEAAAYIASDDKKGIRDLDQHFAELLLTGELYEGWGPGPVTFAGGLTYREEWFNQFSKPIEMERSPANAPALGIRGISAGMTGGNRSMHPFSATSWATGEFDVWEWFTEVNVPTWESGTGDQRLDTNFAFRQSDYSHSGKIDSWKIGADFQIVDGLRFRVTKSRDVREPTFGEQFESGGGGANITDPRSGTTYTITALSGGNPNLKPEEADTLTAGIVFAPTFADWIDGFQISADWYEIEVDGRVGSLGAQRIIDDCQAGNQALCGLIFRSATTGLVERVLNVNLNVAAARTAGVDIEARYSLEPDFLSSLDEDMSFRLFAGHMLENSVTTTTYRDDLGSQQSPEWTATMMGTYNFGDYGVSLIGRYYDSTIIAPLGGALWRAGYEVDDNTIASQTVANLVLSYRGETANGGNWVASFNINNVFDRDPPIQPSENLRGGQQPVGSVYDIFGRRYQLSLNYSF